jgi:release factor glutamine methyltransferase
LIIQQALSHARELLVSSKVTEDASLEAEVLLRNILHVDRVQLRLEPSRSLNYEQEYKYWHSIHRRLQGEPLAYITGYREFFGLDFYVDNRVLIPRPETELIVEEVLKLTQLHPTQNIADVGTGSGAIAVSLAVNLPEVMIYALDISHSALEVASINCHKHGVTERVKLLQGDLLAPLPGPVDVLLANLPYVKSADFDVMPSAGYEPRLALLGGEDGLNQITRLLHQLKGKIRSGGSAFFEIGLGQSSAVLLELQVLFPSTQIEAIKDLSGINRVVKMKLSSSQG